MTIATINATEEQSQYIGQVYQDYSARLRDYFLPQLGNVSETDEYVEKTLRQFFFFMENRCWELETEYIPVYLMRIAGSLCSKRLAEKSMQRSNTLSRAQNSRLFRKVKNEALRITDEIAEFGQLFLKPV